MALKLLHCDSHSEQDTERFLREIRLAARLSHPGILPVFDSGTACGRLYYVMPYVLGESLRNRLDTAQRVDLSDAVQIVRDIAEALDYAHREGIVHRDVKPENILFSHGHALLADFGIARPMLGDTVTAVGVAIGTPTYMSPEQLFGEQVGPPADLFALGCVAYEMVDGSPPFPRAMSAADIARRVSATPAPMRSSPAVDGVIRRAISPDPKDRCHSRRVRARTSPCYAMVSPRKSSATWPVCARYA